MSIGFLCVSFPLQSIIYYTIRSPKLQNWLASSTITEALQSTLDRSFVDLDPIFNHNLDEDFDFRASGITRSSFCSVYMDWIQFCYAKRNDNHKTNHFDQKDQQKSKATSNQSENVDGNNTSNDCLKGISPRSSNNPTPSPRPSKSHRKSKDTKNTDDEIVSCFYGFHSESHDFALKMFKFKIFSFVCFRTKNHH